jgi:hypothetical protein
MGSWPRATRGRVHFLPYLNIRCPISRVLGEKWGLFTDQPCVSYAISFEVLELAAPAKM